MGLKGIGSSQSGGMAQLAKDRWAYTGFTGALAAGLVGAAFLPVAPIAIILGLGGMAGAGVLAIGGHIEHKNQQKLGL